METVILVLHVLTAVCLVALVLLQQGKGADMGAAFGGGSSGSLFGASGSANFLSRATAVLAVIFFLTSMLLTYVSFKKTDSQSLMTKPATEEVIEVPENQGGGIESDDSDSFNEIPE
tara:strand:- start:67 stop:417 length:351 start_codon:yes stop_codon:yes gene_type:complete